MTTTSDKLDAHWCRENPVRAAEELATLKENRDALHAALEGVMDLIDSGVLVRDTSQDTSPDFAVKGLKLVQKLKNAQTALEF